MQPPFWVNGQLRITPTSLTWGNRIANPPPNMTYPGFLNINATKDVVGQRDQGGGPSHVEGRVLQQPQQQVAEPEQRGDVRRAEFLERHQQPDRRAVRIRQRGARRASRPYNQLSRYIEGSYLYNNTEGYIQDNWKVNSRTHARLRRALRAHAAAVRLARPGVELPARRSGAQSQAPVLFAAGCVGDVNPCSGAEPAGAETPSPASCSASVRRPRSARSCRTPAITLNGLYLSGEGITKTTYTYPSLGVAPRFGMAYDPSGRAEDRRCAAVAACSSIVRTATTSTPRSPIHRRSRTSPCATRSCSRSAAGLSTVGAPTLNVYQYDAKLPSSWQWNGGVQMALPWAIGARRGLHRAAQLEHAAGGEHQRRRLRRGVPAAEPGPDAGRQLDAGASAVVTDLMRGYLGYGSITRRMSTLWRTFHGINLSFQRRFTNGVAFGFNDSISALRPPEQQRAPAARRGRIVLLPRRPGRGRCAVPDRSGGAHHQGQLHLGPAGPANASGSACARSWPHRQRLAALGHLDGHAPARRTRSASATRTAAAT